MFVLPQEIEQKANDPSYELRPMRSTWAIKCLAVPKEHPEEIQCWKEVKRQRVFNGRLRFVGDIISADNKTGSVICVSSINPEGKDVYTPIIVDGYDFWKSRNDDTVLFIFCFI